MWSHVACVVFFALYAVADKSDDEKVGDYKEKMKTKMGKKDFGAESYKRPTKCQVCRILAQELRQEINATKDIKKTYSLVNKLDGESEETKRKTIDYKYSEIRLMDILEIVCKNVYNYRTVAGPDFPYLKGVKSMFRQSLEESIKDHGLQLQLDAPDELIEDPTNELRRMYLQCNQMVEANEDDITDWYMQKQDDDPLEFICAERILDKNDHDCLYASTDIPEGTTPPIKENPKERSTFHYKSNHKNEL